MTDGIMATSTIAWSAPSPSSPASSTRRCAALGLDRSLRPSKVADRAVDAQFSMYGNSKSTFTEISYTKLLTFPHLAKFIRERGADRDSDWRIKGKRAWRFPPLEEARKTWDQMTGAKNDWEKRSEWEHPDEVM
jgi:hypothetical protein